MLRQMPHGMLVEWQGYDLVDPISTNWRIDAAMATLAAVNVNIWRNTEKRPDPYVPADFMPEYGPRELPKPQELYKQFRTWALMNQVVKSKK